MPAIRQISATGTPSCPCFKMNAFWASENLDGFIVFRASLPKDLVRKTPLNNDPVSRDQIRHARHGGGDPVIQLIEVAVECLAHASPPLDCMTQECLTLASLASYPKSEAGGTALRWP